MQIRIKNEICSYISRIYFTFARWNLVQRYVFILHAAFLSQKLFIRQHSQLKQSVRFHTFFVKSVYCGGKKSYRKIIDNVKTKDALKCPYETIFFRYLLQVVALHTWNRKSG